jgi:ATP-binding cassette subfamily B protein
VLDNGRIAGLGSHETLLGTCGVYREIFRSQFGKEAV